MSVLAAMSALALTVYARALPSPVPIPVDTYAVDFPRVYNFPMDLIRGSFNDIPQGFAPPYYTLYDDGHNSLLFIATEHSPASFHLLEQIFGVYDNPELHHVQPPGAVIVEAEPTRGCNQPEETPMESCYADELARKRKIPVIRGEYPPVDLLRAVMQRGVSLQDYEGFYLIRTMTDSTNKDQEPSFSNSRRQGFAFEELFATISGEFQREYDIRNQSRLSTQPEFEEWYQKGNGKSFDYQSITYNEATPEGSLFSQQVAREVAIAKDIHLGEEIAKALSSSREVVVVYGASHYSNLRAALGKMLGPAKQRGPQIGAC